MQVSVAPSAPVAAAPPAPPAKAAGHSGGFKLRCGLSMPESSEPLTEHLPGKNNMCHLRQLRIMLEREVKHLPSVDCIEKLQAPHSGMNPSWRKQLVEWMLDFMCAYKYRPEICALAVNYVDRFMSKVAVDKDCLQLLVIVACFTASKLLGRAHIRLAELMSMFPEFSSEHFRGTEVHMAFALDWDLNSTTAHTFVQWLSPFLPELHKEAVLRRAELIADVCMTDHAFLRYRPSQIGLAAMEAAYQFYPKLDPSSYLRAVRSCGVDLPHASVPVVIEPIIDLFVKTFPELSRPVLESRATSPTSITHSFAPLPSPCPSPRPAAAAPSPTPLVASVEAAATSATEGDIDMS